MVAVGDLEACATRIEPERLLSIGAAVPRYREGRERRTGIAVIASAAIAHVEIVVRHRGVSIEPQQDMLVGGDRSRHRWRIGASFTALTWMEAVAAALFRAPS